MGGSDSWPKRPPIESLHLLSRIEDGALEDGAQFVSRANFGNAVGTWNAPDPSGAYAAKPGEWIIVQADLGRHEDDDDDDDTVAVTFACWKVSDGYAVAITPMAQASVRVPIISGIPWPADDDWKQQALWYGE